MIDQGSVARLRPFATPGASVPVRRWVAACAAGEAVGIAVAALAVGSVADGAGPGAALRAAVLAGIAEGASLGWCQWRELRQAVPRLGAAAWVGATVGVAILAWVGASLPPTGAGTGSAPPLLLVLPFAALLGAAFGAVLGTAQSLALIGCVRHPGRWVGANAGAWSVAMAVIYLGASAPDESLAWPALLALGAVTGLVAGAAVGGITGIALPRLDDGRRLSLLRHIGNAVAVALLRSPFHAVLGPTIVLTVTGRRSGRRFTFPVVHAADGDRMVVVAGHGATKTWWKNLRPAAEVRVTVGGRQRVGTARALPGGDPARADAVRLYRETFPRARLSAADPVVVIALWPRGQWVVKLEAARRWPNGGDVGEGGDGADGGYAGDAGDRGGEVRWLLDVLPGAQPVTVPTRDRYALRMRSSAAGASEALTHALARWQAAVEAAGDRPRLIRAEVLTTEEFERERLLAYEDKAPDGEAYTSR